MPHTRVEINYLKDKLEQSISFITSAFQTKNSIGSLKQNKTNDYAIRKLNLLILKISHEPKVNIKYPPNYSLMIKEKNCNDENINGIIP